MTNIEVYDEDIGKRLDVFITEREDVTRAFAQKLIEEGNVLVLGVQKNKNYKIRKADEISIEYPPPRECEAAAEDIPVDIVYEDEDIIVVNKPRGMVVHPAAGNYSGTLVNALMFLRGAALSDIGGVIRPGIVHRIDKDTSGLLVVAKNNDAHLFLSAEIKEHKVSRIYHAIAIGRVDENMTLDYPIGRSSIDRKKMAVTEKNSKNAVTHVEVMESFTGATYVKCILETGRTHQIRVHMAYKGHALLGDEVYATTKTLFEKRHVTLFDGQMLHARRLSFIHPRTKEKVEFEAPLPENFERALQILRTI